MPAEVVCRPYAAPVGGVRTRPARGPVRAAAAALLVAAVVSGCAGGGGKGETAAKAGAAAPPASPARSGPGAEGDAGPAAASAVASGSAAPSASPSGSGSATPTGSSASAPSSSAPSAASGSPSASGVPHGRPALPALSPRPVRPPMPAMGPKGPLQGPGALSPYAPASRTAAARLAVARKWGLSAAPPAAPPPPAVKPVITTRKGFEVEGGDEGLPPVFTRVPVKDKIVFITIDDGSEKEPDFLRMMSELKVPYSAFLSDYLISDDYGYFRTMQAQGVTLSNHTLHHPYLPGLSYGEQKHEICDQQDKLAEEYGKRPTLFRPPYGNYDGDTLRVAKACGIKAIPLWETEAFPTHMDWRDEAQEFQPGDIILTHFQGPSEWKATMTENIRNLLKRITDQGFAVARLEDYV